MKSYAGEYCSAQILATTSIMIGIRLLNESLSAMREGHMKPVKPLQVFDVSEITQAFRQFSLGSRMGKIAVSFEDRNSLVKVRLSDC